MSQPASSSTSTTAPAVKHGTGPKGLYVRVLLGLLPTLIRAGRHLSKTIANETAYQAEGFRFALTVAGTDLACACQKRDGKWHRIPSSSAPECDYIIGFRSLNYAFAVFTGGLSLKDALAARMFTTRGPNDTGVALTYMFNVLLRTFFFFRAAYRR